MSESETGEDQSAGSEGEGHRPASRGEPILRGVVKIDFNDDEAISEMTAGIAEAIMMVVKESGIPLAPKGEGGVMSIGGVTIPKEHRGSSEEAYAWIDEALHAEYQAILAFLPSRKKLGRSDFMAIVDAHIHRRLSNGDGAGLVEVIQEIEAALEWGEVDISGIDICDYDGTEVWEAVAEYLVTFSYDEGGGDSLAVLDFGRGVTYVAVDTNEDRGVYDYEIIAEVDANDGHAVSDIARSEMWSGASWGEPLGKWPDMISVSPPVTADDVRETFRKLFVSSESVAEEYNEWMMNNGYQALPLGTDSEREALADAYLDLVLDEGV